MKFNAYKLVPQEARRNRAALRTAVELAEEFGTSRQRLYVLFKSHEGPSPVFDYRDRVGPKRNWYEPSAVRKWWNALPEEVRHSPKLGKKEI